ncbi:MAG: hypothetical protein K2X86_03205 [Cytophagaceae bacterium]|nr:hypothetical protein [Cytophagaceae bacterium]
MKNTLIEKVMKYIHKRRLVSFLEKYTRTKEKAKDLMSTGDVNAYLKELIETERSKKKALAFIKNC